MLTPFCLTEADGGLLNCNLPSRVSFVLNKASRARLGLMVVIMYERRCSESNQNTKCIQKKLEVLCSADASAPEDYERPSLETRLPVALQESLQRAGSLFTLIVQCAQV